LDGWRDSTAVESQKKKKNSNRDDRVPLQKGETLRSWHGRRVTRPEHSVDAGMERFNGAGVVFVYGGTPHRSLPELRPTDQTYPLQFIFLDPLAPTEARAHHNTYKNRAAFFFEGGMDYQHLIFRDYYHTTQ
jgi:hypothetical protein